MIQMDIIKQLVVDLVLYCPGADGLEQERTLLIMVPVILDVRVGDCNDPEILFRHDSIMDLRVCP